MDFPYADAASIIRANQKDLFVENELSIQLRDLVQGIKGVRFTHNWAKHLQAFSTFAYLCLTSLAGSRTLGEEYTDIFYLTQDRKIPSKWRVGLYVLSSGLAPLCIPKLAIRMKNLLRKLRKHKNAGTETSNGHKEAEYEDDDDDEEDDSSFLADNLTPATIMSINLTIFYFSGAYYQLSKRIFGLRYAFGHRVDPLTQPSGSYELIGVLMVVRGVLQLVSGIKSRIHSTKEEVNSLPPVQDMGASLDDSKLLPFIHGQSRRCNLCLENMRAPTVTLCGHMYCWNCISGWCRDQTECPFCRQECHEQHLLCLSV